jgi:ABC-type transport system involved in cytochrome c biogenesis permease subunit
MFGAADSRSEVSSLTFRAEQILAALASLKLTVILFSLSLFLVFVGTLAQKDQDVWRVVNDTYFRVWFAHVDLQVFERLAQLFWKGIDWNLQGWFPFLGGKTLGLALLVNLAAAHAIRFKIAAEGRRLWLGLATIVVGLLITALAITSGINRTVESELSAEFCDILWQCFRGLLALCVLAGAYVLTFWGGPSRRKLIEWRVALGVEIVLAIVTIYLLSHPAARIDNSGIRILWQLAKGSASGVVLLVGCVMVFRKRAGIVLLHGGIALIMLTELFTAVAAVESQMHIANGGTANFSSDIRTVELSVVDHSPADHDSVTVVPRDFLIDNIGQGEKIDNAELPFKIQVLSWMQNSKLQKPAPGEKNPATAGFGKDQIAVSIPASTGTGEFSEQQDYPSAYIELFSKDDGKSLGTYLVSQRFEDDHHRIIDQPVEVNGKTYDLALRFKRIYHPFTVTLKEFSMSHYVGTTMAKNYQSLVNFKDPQHNVEREVLIWMNNPLRYSGTTLYQQGVLFDQTTGAPNGTTLQTVENSSWMTPYVGCMLVAIGMLAHFGTMLVRFLRRRSEDTIEQFAIEDTPLTAKLRRGARARDVKSATTPIAFPIFTKAFPFILLVCFVGYIASKARLPESKPNEMHIYEFGKLPVVYEGRVKPFDTLARNTLQVLSASQQVHVLNDKGEATSNLPAIRWLLDVASDAKGASDHRVFRIENLDLLDALNLPRRPQFWRYSLNEIRAKRVEAEGEDKGMPEVLHQIALAKTTPEEKRDLYHEKVLDLERKLSIYIGVKSAFDPPPLNLSGTEQEVKASLLETQQRIASLNASATPRIVPPTAATNQWSTYMQAEFDLLRDQIQKSPVNPATTAIHGLLTAYGTGNVAEFNKQLGEYRSILRNYEQLLGQSAAELKAAGVAKSEILSQKKTSFEVFFNQFSPFYYAMVLYVVAFMLGIFSWVGWTEPLRKASIWLLWFTLALHTYALVSRVYISGRPPITNLYSTAIFIGWAVVLLSLAFESIQKLGLANIVASVIGFITLFLAYNLSLDGDTFTVLQAVLDTQFWLATHVISINLGYAATYATGAWGIVYILCCHVFNVLDDNARSKVLRTLYGTLCFAIFFSFVGTVLGGLWGDDSWGRFWGWDPKENGALMIVLWNALVLHARWGGLVKGRGLATLAVGGNIITTWSYFGVNAYGVGLHAYGGNTTSTAMWLLGFGMSQLAIIALGCMPKDWFTSREKNVATI